MNTPEYQEALRRIEKMKYGELRLNNLGLTVLPPLPPTVRALQCVGNQLTSLPELPESLTSLLCGENQLTSLPELPQKLQILYCDSNQLTSLPVLPPKLFSLNCNRNQLKNLPALPANLSYLFCSDNQLTTIPELPEQLQNGGFGFQNNPLIEPYATYYMTYLETTNMHQLRNSIRSYHATVRAKGREVASLKGIAKNSLFNKASSYALTHPVYSGLIGQMMTGKNELFLENQTAALKRNVGRGGSRKTRKNRKGRKSRKSGRK